MSERVKMRIVMVVCGFIGGAIGWWIGGICKAWLSNV